MGERCKTKLECRLYSENGRKDARQQAKKYLNNPHNPPPPPKKKKNI